MLKKWLVRIAIFAGCIACLVVLLFALAWSLLGYASASSRAPKEYKDWQANGLPITQDQVFLTPAPKDEDNAAPLIGKAARLIRDKEGKKISISDLSAKARWADGSVSRFIEKHRPSLDLTIEATDRASCRFPRDWDRGYRLEFPDNVDFHQLSFFLSWDARFRREKGDWRGSLRSIRATRRLGNFISQSALVFTISTGTRADERALAEVGQLAFACRDNPEALAAIRTMLKETEWKVDRKQVFRGEAYMMLASYRGLTEMDGFHMLQAGTFPDQPRIVREGIPSARLVRPVASEWMRLWNTFYPRLIDEKEDIVTVTQDMEATASGAKPSMMMALLSLSSMKSYALEMKGQIANARAALAYVAVLEYRAVHGTFPATLKQAGVALIDEYDGKPIRYERTSDKEIKVWNIGRDLVDQAGSRAIHGSGISSYRGDTVFAYPWPKP